MAPITNKFLDLTSNMAYTSANNNGKVDGAQVVNYATQFLTEFFGSLNKDEEAVSKEAKAANNIDKSSEKVKKSTETALAKYDEKTEELKANIQKNLDRAEAANNERERIQNELEKEVEKIEDAKKVLNDPTSSHQDRVDAIKQLQASGTVMTQLLADSEKLAEEVENAQKEIDEYSSEIDEVSDDAEETVEDGETKLESLENKTEEHTAVNQGLAANGTSTIAQGETHIAEGEAATVGGAPLIAKGTQEVQSGTSVEVGAQKNTAQLNITASQIRVNLAELTPEKVSIGDARNVMVDSATQISDVWGVLGTWTEEYSNSLEGTLEEYNSAVDEAAEKVGVTIDSETGTVTETETDTDTGSEEQNDDNSNDGEIFTFDTEKLKNLFSSKDE